LTILEFKIQKKVELMKKNKSLLNFENVKISKTQTHKILGGIAGGDGALGGSDKPLTNPRRPKQD
jgi:hypothetical protein